MTTETEAMPVGKILKGINRAEGEAVRRRTQRPPFGLPFRDEHGAFLDKCLGIGRIVPQIHRSGRSAEQNAFPSRPLLQRRSLWIRFGIKVGLWNRLAMA